MGGKGSKDQSAAADTAPPANLVAPYPIASDVKDVAKVVATYEAMYRRCGKFMQAQEACKQDDQECMSRAFLHLNVCLASCVEPCAAHAKRVTSAMDRFRTTERTTNEVFESEMAPNLASAVQGQQACLDRFDELAKPVLARYQRQQQEARAAAAAASPHGAAHGAGGKGCPVTPEAQKVWLEAAKKSQQKEA